MRKAIRVLVPGLLFLVYADLRAEVVELRNGVLSVAVDTDAKGAIRAITDLTTGRDFVKTDAPAVPLYTITLADEQHQRTVITSLTCDAARCRKSPDGVSLVLEFEHAKPQVKVEATVRLPEQGPMSYWSLDVHNATPLAVISADFPGLALPQALGQNPDDTEVILPNPVYAFRFWNLPEEFKYAFNIAKFKENKNSPVEWPFTLRAELAPDAEQMMACYDQTAGLYMATLDGNAHVKQLSVEGIDASTMRLKFEHRRPWAFGKDFTMGYDVAVGVFHGDWAAAADLYRDWAEKQVWCSAGKLKEKDTPEWVKQYPLFLRFGVQRPGRKGGTEWAKIPGILQASGEKYPELYKNAIVHVFDFDVGGYWQGFYGKRWPAFMGDDVFAAFVKQVKAKGQHPCIEPFGWSVQFTGRDYIKDYDIRKEPFWADLRDTKLVWSEDNVLKGGGPTGAAGSVCLATDEGMSVFAGDAQKTAPWGMDMIMVMETGVVGRMNCFKTTHGHPMGAGQWIYQKAHESVKKMREVGRSLNPDFCIDKENTAEYLISVMDTQYPRCGKTGTMRNNGRPQIYRNNVPLFDYIYHQYIISLSPCIAGTPETMRWCASNCISLGALTGPAYGADPATPCYQNFERGGAFELLKTAQEAYNSYAREYVVFGRVLPAPGVKFGEMQHAKQTIPLCWYWQANTQAAFVTPKVIQTAHQAPGGGIGLTFINAADESIPFRLDPAKYASYLGKFTVKCAVRQNGKPVKESDLDLKAPNPSLDLTIEPRAFLFVTLD